jgi:hypothetical protein
LGIVLAYVGTRLLPVCLQPGGEDEDFYAVPGLTVLTDGIPRLPHVPARNAESVFFRADEALFAEPPLMFYLEAALYSVLPRVYGTARLISLAAGVVVLVAGCRLARDWGCSRLAALFGMGMLSTTRWFFFPAMRARPDMLCAMFGLLALLCLVRWQRDFRWRWLIVNGVLLGLGGLTHPFAIVYAIQSAVWVAWASGGWRRALRPLLMAATAMALFSVWLLLMWRFPEVARVQLQNQFFHSSGGNLIERLLWPWESVSYHLLVTWNHVGPWQAVLPLAGLMAALVSCRLPTHRGLRAPCLLAGSSMYLLSACVGPHHLTTGYWVYPGVFVFQCTGWAIARGLQRVSACRRRGWWLAWGTGLCLLASLLPGGGYRVPLSHLRHWGDIHYDAPRFARHLIDSVPASALCTVDTQFAFDFLVAGRQIILLKTSPDFLLAHTIPSDYLVVSRQQLGKIPNPTLPGRLLWTRGVRDDLLACYVEVYRRDVLPTDSPPPTAEGPAPQPSSPQR